MILPLHAQSCLRLLQNATLVDCRALFGPPVLQRIGLLLTQGGPRHSGNPNFTKLRFDQFTNLLTQFRGYLYGHAPLRRVEQGHRLALFGHQPQLISLGSSRQSMQILAITLAPIEHLRCPYYQVAHSLVDTACGPSGYVRNTR